MILVDGHHLSIADLVRVARERAPFGVSDESADQEDHVSMGATAAHKAAEILRNVADVVGVAAICAAPAADRRTERGPLPAVAALGDAVREEIPFWREDRYASPDLKRAARLVRSGRLLSAVEREVGPPE